MITFNATVTKKPAAGKAMPAAPPQTRSAATSSYKRELSRPVPQTPQTAFQLPKQPSAPPIRKQIREDVFYTFPFVETQKLSAEAPAAQVRPAPKHAAPAAAWQPRTYAALKTAQLQHEQILARITGK